MSARAIAIISWIVLGFGIAVIIGSYIIGRLTPGLPPELGTSPVNVYGGSIVCFALLGALIAVRRPGNRFGWLLTLVAFIHASGYLMAAVAGSLLYADPPNLAAGRTVAWVFVWSAELHYGPEVTFVFLLFPDGRLPSSRWRPVAWLTVASIVVATAAIAVLPGPLPVYGFDNPYVIDGPVPFAAVSIAYIVGAGCALAAIASLFVRYRHAAGDERQQLKWFLYGGAVAAVGVIAILGLGLSIASSALLVSAVTIVMAAAAAVAIFRYHLFDIDLLINRTLVYGLTTAVVALAFFAIVVLLQALLRPVTSGSEIAVAASTLGTLALVGPIRRRTQDGVDRRFYRSRFDAVRTVDEFAVRLRDEVDLDAVRVELLATVHQTMQPALLSVWLRERAG